jgi:2-amino-4-hydroxy-6-hydroxymethyldihydropteridine diphosphokinase
MNKVYLLIGGNMGDRMANLDIALNLMELNLGAIIQISSRYETAAWGLTDQPNFINQAVLMHTSLSANELMQAILDVEKLMGRERTIPLGPRNIDIDIIYYNDEIINNESLTVPHPKMTERRFVLLPMVEIAPHYIHPILSKSNTLLLKECGDSLAVHKKTP